MDIQAYFKRIALPEQNAPAAQKFDALGVPALRSLVRAHLEAVPFENLDIAGHGRVLPMTEEALFEKIVLQGRGGYCFELNKLFYLLLEALGYDCYPVVARIIYRRTDFRPLSHRMTVVRLEGKKWLCDVGYGGPGPKGLVCLSTDEPQEIAGEIFSVQEKDNDAMMLLRHDPDGVQPMIVFWDRPWPEVDFETLNGYFSMHPDSVFTQKIIMHRCIPGGQISFVGDTYTIKRQGQPEEASIITDSGERGRLLRDKFGIMKEI